MHTKFWSENLKGKDHLEELGVDRKVVLKWILGKVWTGCIYLRLGTSGGLL
jgi:hypothetical protein